MGTGTLFEMLPLMAGTGAAEVAEEEKWEGLVPAPRVRCRLVCLARVGVPRGGERRDTDGGAVAAA